MGVCGFWNRKYLMPRRMLDRIVAYRHLFLNDINPPVIHEASTQKTYNGQDSSTRSG